MNKTYLSLSISRQLAGEFPVGDPFGGPAYGDKEMPFAVIGGAIASAAAAVGTAVTGAVAGAAAAGSAAAVSLGATAGGAVATAAGVVSAVATVATWVGVGLTVVGAVTGNTDLMKIGGYVGLAGGVTGLAVAGVNAAFSAASTTTANAVSTASAESAASNTASLGAAGTEAAKAAITPQFASVASEQAIAPVVASGAPVTAAGEVTRAGVGMLSTGSSGVTPTLASGATSGVGETANAVVNTAETAATSGVDKVVANVGNVGKDVGGNVVGEGSSFFDKLSKLDGVLNVGGEVLKGMAAGGMQDDMMDLRRDQLAIDQQRLDLDQQRFGYDQMAKERAYQNGNTQGRLNIGTRELTPEEQAAASAKKARNMAQVLTQPAG